jgi:hypothetical protein
MSAPKSSHLPLVFFSSLLFLAGPLSIAAGKTIRINKVAMPMAEPASLDEELRLKKLLLFPSVDDVSGVLTPDLDSELATAASNYTRFDIVRDREIIKALKTDGESYNKVSHSDTVHREAIKAANADASILLSSETAGGNLQLTLELRDRSGQVLLSGAEKIPAFSAKDARAKRIATMFSDLVKKIPFAGTVTGRSGKTITIDLGRGDVKVGDELNIAKITSQQRHPLLKTLVSTTHTRVGTAKVTNVDRALSFAEITEEAPGEAVTTNNKIVAVQPGQEEKSDQYSEQGWAHKESDTYSIKQRGEDIVPKLEGEFDKPTPQFGYATADLGYGSINHQHTTPGASGVEASGSGLGGNLAGEVWLTKNWNAGGSVNFQRASMDATTEGGAVQLDSASWSKYEVYGGYRIFPGKIDEISVLFGLGYASSSINLENNATVGTGPRTYSGILFKADGDIMILPKNKIWVGLEIIPFGTFEETSTGLGDSNSVSEIGVHFDWLHELMPNLWGRVGIKMDFANASATAGGTDSEKHFIFGPGVLYYF